MRESPSGKASAFQADIRGFPRSHPLHLAFIRRKITYPTTGRCFFMSTKTDTNQAWALASYALNDAYTDFILSRQAMLCGERTIAWYSFTLGKVMEWMVQNGVTSPPEISARHVRAYLSNLTVRGL